MGSPPPMRGKVGIFDHAGIITGITPAYAGKRRGTFTGMLPREDHPRLCGEKKILGGENDGNQDHPRLCGEKLHEIGYGSGDGGSPPPMRGKVRVGGVGWVCVGITPAYAGKSFQRSKSYLAEEDHPRLCGEKHDLRNGRF